TSTNVSAGIAASPQPSPRGRGSTDERFSLDAQELPDAVDVDVAQRVLRKDLRIVRVVALARKDGGHPLAPDALDGRQDAQLVVHQDVVLGGKSRLDILQLLLLVYVDQHVALDGRPQTRTLDLARLKHHVSVRQDDHRPPTFKTVDDVQRLRVQPVRKRIVDQVVRQVQQVRFVRMLEAIALE